MKFEISNINIISSDYGDLLGDFWITIQVDISEKSQPGAEVFSFNAVGIERLKKLVEINSRFGKGLIILSEYNELKIREMIQVLIRNLTTWEELMTKLTIYSA